MGESLKHVENLNSENYSIWKVLMKALLVDNGYWNLIISTESASEASGVPADVANAGNGTENLASASATLETPADTTVYSATNRAATEKALALTILAISDDQLIHFDQCKTAKEAWQKSLSEESSIGDKMRLYEKLLTLKLGTAESARAHIQEFSSVRSEIRSIGVNIDSNLYKLALLRSVSNRFDNLIVA